MKRYFYKNLRIKKFLSILILALLSIQVLSFSGFKAVNVNAMPFYGLEPKSLVLRAEFSTEYKKSSKERKHNIALAVKSINNTLLEAGGEFSFNNTVGERSEKRGYEKAKIISGGQFVDGVGGGVCQVSTTLYNAALLSGLIITEYHPHSLAVSYIEPSFDAMVNSSYADLKFINPTKNPVIINAKCDGEKITVRITGEKMIEKYIRESKKTEILPLPENVVVIDEKGEYPELLSGEKIVVSYGKQGKKSEGYLIKTVNGKRLSRKKIRTDTYKSTPNIYIEGKGETS